MNIIAVGAFVAIMCGGGRASLAADIYVTANTSAPAGSGTLASPYNNLAVALSAAYAGDSVRLLAGTYVGPFTLPRSGEVGRPIRLTPHGARNSAVIDCQGANVNCLTIDRANITVEGLEVRNAAYNGIKVDGDVNGTLSAMSYGNYGGYGERPYHVNGADNVILVDNFVHDIGFDCLKIGHVNNLVIKGNDITMCGLNGQQQGIDLVGVYNATISDNHIHDDGAVSSMDIGLFAKGGSQDILVENNLVENIASPNAGIEIGGDTEWYNTRYTPSEVQQALGYDLNATILGQTAASNNIDSSTTYRGEYMAEARRVVVRGNVVKQADPGLSARNTYDAKFYNNTVLESGWSQGWVKIWNDGNSYHANVNLKLVNNLYSNRTVQVRAAGAIQDKGAIPSNRVGYESDYNLYWNNGVAVLLGVTGYDAHSKFADPQLDGYDVPRPTGTAYNAGVNLISQGLLPATTTLIDRNGTTRPAYGAMDIGALEYQLSTPNLTGP